MTPNEVEESIHTLNEEFYTAELPDLPGPFIQHSDGHQIVVDFLGSPVWSSDDDERDLDEETGEFEPLENLLRRESRRILGVLCESVMLSDVGSDEE